MSLSIQDIPNIPVGSVLKTNTYAAICLSKRFTADKEYVVIDKRVTGAPYHEEAVIIIADDGSPFSVFGLIDSFTLVGTSDSDEVFIRDLFQQGGE